MPRTKITLLPIAKRIIRLNELIQVIEFGGDVPTSAMHEAVYPDELIELKLNLNHIKTVLPNGARPSPLKRYEVLLKRADSMRNRPPAKSPKICGPSLLGQKVVSRTEESAYEAALVYLEEYLDNSMRGWLDRWPDFENPGKSPAATAEDVPRLITSKSNFANEPGRLSEERRRLKMVTLRASLDACLSP